MKKALTTILLLVSIVSFPETILAAFGDVPADHRNFVAINYLSDKGIITGYENGLFEPEKTVNRVEALKIILKNGGYLIPDTCDPLPFNDVDNSAWYAPFIATAQQNNVANGNPDGTFSPDRQVMRAEFIKMLLMANSFVKEKWEGMQIFNDIPQNEWYAPYMNYAGQAGLLMADDNNNLNPAEPLTRGEVAEIIYIMTIIINGKDTQFLISQAEAQMGQIDIYISKNDPDAAKRASELAVDMTQQAYGNLPDDTIVLGTAKLARAYDFVVNSYIAAIDQDYTTASDWANQAITKADEAFQVNPETQPIATHIKTRANEILAQIFA